jgi:hypothetical protein
MHIVKQMGRLDTWLANREMRVMCHEDAAKWEMLIDWWRPYKFDEILMLRRWVIL